MQLEIRFVAMFPLFSFLIEPSEMPSSIISFGKSVLHLVLKRLMHVLDKYVHMKPRYLSKRSFANPPHAAPRHNLLRLAVATLNSPSFVLNEYCWPSDHYPRLSQSYPALTPTHSCIFLALSEERFWSRARDGSLLPVRIIICSCSRLASNHENRAYYSRKVRKSTYLG
jgi:hypothetical protein